MCQQALPEHWSNAGNLFARTDRDYNRIGCDTTELQDKWLPLDFQADAFPYTDTITSA